MRRLNVLAEGQTEEAFVNQVLAPHLGAFGVFASVRCVTTRRDRIRPDLVYRGGLRDFGKVRRDLERWLAEDHSAAFTTMFDLYALPRDFPGYADAARLADPYARSGTWSRRWPAPSVTRGSSRTSSFTNSKHSSFPIRKSSTGSTSSMLPRSRGW